MNWLKGFLNLLLISVTITAVFFPFSVFVHEGTHVLMYTMEGIPVISFHVFDADSFEKGACGFITTSKVSIVGNVVQEAIAYFFQFLFMVASLLFCLMHPFKTFTVQQLESIASRPNSPQVSVSGC